MFIGIRIGVPMGGGGAGGTPTPPVDPNAALYLRTITEKGDTVPENLYLRTIEEKEG